MDPTHIDVAMAAVAGGNNNIIATPPTEILDAAAVARVTLRGEMARLPITQPVHPLMLNSLLVWPYLPRLKAA